MEQEKINKIKKVLKQNTKTCLLYDFGKDAECKVFQCKDVLDYINELEERNEKLKQSNKNILFVNDKVIERNQELEEALLDMVVQFCQMDKEGDLCHAFMSAEENAFDVLDIEYGEKVDDVYKRFNERWGKKDGE